jgi:hypothetical protein
MDRDLFAFRGRSMVHYPRKMDEIMKYEDWSRHKECYPKWFWLPSPLEIERGKREAVRRRQNILGGKWTKHDRNPD